MGATNFFALGTLNAHQVAYFRDIGFSAMVAAMFYSLVSVMSVVGRFGLGALALRFEVRRLAVFSFAVQLCAFIILLVTENLGFLYLYAIFFGVSCGAIVVALPTFVAEYFGSSHYALIMGLILPLGLAAESAGPVVAGAMYDITSTYTFVFILLISVSLLGLACAVFLRSPKPQ